MRVAFVVMPFHGVRPALGVSLLQARLTCMGVESETFYLNLRLAAALGEEAYRFIATDSPTTMLAGEWVFAHCLAEGAARPDRYVQAMRRRYPPEDLPDSGIQVVVSAREAAAGFLDECLAAVDWGAFDLIGFTSTFAQNTAALSLARRIKERYPGTRIAFGGANCEGGMGLQLYRSFSFVDFVATGEADLSFPRLVHALDSAEEPAGIPGILSRFDRSPEVKPELTGDLDALPYPEFGDFFRQHAELELSPELWLPMETSRGCWWGAKHHCTFCGLNGLTMAYRLKTPGRALDELLYLHDRYRRREIAMADNILDRRYLQTFLPELRDRKVGLRIFYETKANLTREQLVILRDAGVTEIQPGLESLSTHTLWLMRKGTTAIQNVQLLKWCAELGIGVSWNMLYGFPGETSEDYAEAVALMGSLHHLGPPVTLGRIRIDRFSPYFDDPAAFGLRNLRPDRSYAYIYARDREEVEELAYYFEADPPDGPDLTQSVAELDAAYRRWRAGHSNARLTWTDDGDVLRIEDARDNAARPVHELRGADRELYRYCDPNRSLSQILALAESLGKDAPWVYLQLDGLVEQRLMATADGRYLSLAVTPPDIERLAARIASWFDEPAEQPR